MPPSLSGRVSLVNTCHLPLREREQAGPSAPGFERRPPAPPDSREALGKGDDQSADGADKTGGQDGGGGAFLCSLTRVWISSAHSICSGPSVDWLRSKARGRALHRGSAARRLPPAGVRPRLRNRCRSPPRAPPPHRIADRWSWCRVLRPSCQSWCRLLIRSIGSWLTNGISRALICSGLCDSNSSPSS